jgi:DNA mismatch repair ATPase MutS
MLIDRTTLSDLELFSARDGHSGIFDLIDHTSTGLGRAALRRRLETPLTTADQIRDVQAGLAVLEGLTTPLRFNDRVLIAAQAYVRSSVVLSRRTRLGAAIAEAWLRVRYREIHRELVEGQASIRALRASIGRVVETLDRPGLPDTLGSAIARLRSIASGIDRALMPRSLLVSDRLLREGLRDEIPEAVQILAGLDALQSMALAGKSPGWSRPVLVDSEQFLLDVEDAFHPFVEDGTPNPVQLHGGEPLVFLTGPNMAGKTTYLRTVALVVLLAQTGMNVPAASVRLAPVEAILTSLNPTDNLREGISYFYAEILRVKEAAQLLADGRRALILFDEVFKGTNVQDALEASAQVIEGFANASRSGAIFSSHLTELAGVLRENPAIRFCQFGGEIVGAHPSFTYRLEPGVSDRRFGLLLLRRAEVPELLARISA